MNEALYPFWKKKIVTAAKTSKSRSWIPLNSITNLAYSVKSATSVYLSWTLPVETFDGVRVYSSTDGVTYAQVGADLANTATNYTHNAIDAGSARYWYVIMFKGSTEGGKSNIVNLDWFTMQATLTGAATLTLALVDVVAGDGTTIFWGDGTANSYTSANNASAKTRAYAGAGTYVVKIANPLNISVISFGDTKLTNFNSNQFLKCGDNLASVTLNGIGATPTINSADMALLKLSVTLLLRFTQAGTYTINSDHFKAYTLNFTCYLRFDLAGTYTINSDHFKDYTLSSIFYLWFTQAGTYAINSDHFKAYTLSNTLQLLFTQAGTYAIDSDHFKAYTLSAVLVLSFTQAGTYTINSDHFKNYTLTSDLSIAFTQAGTYNIARADITFVRIPTVSINIPSLATSTDLILLGFYDRLPAKTNNGGTINLAGCPAPTGVYGASGNCALDPNGGKGAAYELINDSCSRAAAAARRWTSVTVTGGGTP